MSRPNAFPVPAWALAETLELETAEEDLAAALEAEAPVVADMLFMAGVDVLLAREEAHAFTLTLKHRGKPTEVRLIATLDEQGEPYLVAELP